MKYLFGAIFLMAVWFAHPQTDPSRNFINPVIPGDHPDCTLTKAGDHFYTTGSSFNPTPVIYHSTDLVHWEAIAQPVSASWTGYGDSPGGGFWGGQLVFYNGKFWDFFSRANMMYYVKADRPEGPWSSPVKINNPSYPYSWAEGPVMWKYGGYYYYSFARDVAGGQKVMRSLLHRQMGADDLILNLNLEKGIYLLKISNGKEFATGKLCIN